MQQTKLNHVEINAQNESVIRKAVTEKEQIKHELCFEVDFYYLQKGYN